jgi:general secretion pathway protein B
MSLVLEALKKQESEQDPGAAVAFTLAAEQKRRQRTWIAVLAVALLLNAGVLSWLFRDQWRSTTAVAGAAGTQASATDPASRTDPADAISASDPAPAGATGSASPTAADALAPDPLAANAAAPTIMVEQPPRVLERRDLDSLPAGPRSRFPGIVFSTHIYAQDPDLRAIVANGERLQEGDLIRNLPIRQITEHGVLLEFESYLVEVPVFVDW